MKFEIPLVVYRYILIITIFIVIGIGLLLYFKFELTNIQKTILIWYIIILEANLLHLFYIFYFYDKNKIKVGKKGQKGLPGARGIKGISQFCSSCGTAGKVNNKYGTNINDFGETIKSSNNPPASIENPKVTSREAKCIFPFIYNYQYYYDSIKSEKPPDRDINDAFKNGWCATKVDKDLNVIEYGYTNQSSSIQKRLDKEREYRKNRDDYMKNNYGILDITIVTGTTESKAISECNEKPGYKYYPQDLNDNVGGKGGDFIYLCYKKGLGNKGIVDLRVKYEKESDRNETLIEDGFIKINVDLNKGFTKEKQGENGIYLYKKYSNSNFIKNIYTLVNQSLSSDSQTTQPATALTLQSTQNEKIPVYTLKDTEDLGDKSEIADLNKYGDGTNITLYYDKIEAKMYDIDTAFVYKDKHLYIFTGSEFIKMSNKVTNNQIIAVNGYPKTLAEKWGNSVLCSNIEDEKECNTQQTCNFSTDKKMCQDSSNYDAAFTYGYNNKTYFFRGTQVFLYDDQNQKIAKGYPKNIEKVFKGVPSNINAVFTWGKDRKTYFFKGPFYYKYNDKNKKVENGYPRRTSDRWVNIPLLFEAIFTLPKAIDTINIKDKHPTYIISGDKSYYIDPISDKVINGSDLSQRFSNIN